MHIKHVSTELDHLLHKYGDNFRNELGKLKGIEAKLVVHAKVLQTLFRSLCHS